MRNFYFKKKNVEELYIENKVKNYIFNYLKELQRHFDVSDRKMRFLINQVHKELKPSWLTKKLLYVKILMNDFLSDFKRKIKWR